MEQRLEAVTAESKEDIRGSRRTIFHHIAVSDLSTFEKSTERLVDKAFGVIGAGQTTTAGTLATISYHVISQPAIRMRLPAELLGAKNSKQKMTLRELTAIPHCHHQRRPSTLVLGDIALGSLLF